MSLERAPISYQICVVGYMRIGRWFAAFIRRKSIRFVALKRENKACPPEAWAEDQPLLQRGAGADGRGDLARY